MRRKDKEITDKKEIEQIFKQAQICRLGLLDDRRPYIVPMNFGYRDNTIYFHSASSGKKIDLLKQNPEVCFEVDIPSGVVKAEEACSWTMGYRSLMGEGKAVFIEGTENKCRALNIIMEHYSENNKWDFDTNMVESIAVFKIEIKYVSAKKSGNRL